ncbi:MAG: aldehyde dehydrogenase family protein, partial [Vicinamibacterales bacterium]
AAAAELERDCPAKQLGHWLSQLHALMMQQQRELARLITLEQDKPLKESFAEVEYAAGFFRLFSEQLARLDSEPLPRRIRNLKWTLHHRPAGRPAKGTPCGLAAYVFSNDPARAGMGRAPEAPFGGAIQSGLGREGAIEELLEFCVTVVGP